MDWCKCPWSNSHCVHPVLCTKARLQSHCDQGDAVHCVATLLPQCHPVRTKGQVTTSNEPQTNPDQHLCVTCGKRLTCSSSILAEAALGVCAASGRAERTGELFQQLPAGHSGIGDQSLVVDAGVMHECQTVCNSFVHRRISSYLGVVVVRRYVKPGWDDWRLSCGGGKNWLLSDKNTLLSVRYTQCTSVTCGL